MNGAAVGFGATIAALCDLVLISDRAFIAEPHINVGLFLGDGIAVSWPLMMGLLKAKELIFTGKRISAYEAVSCGLANRVVEHERLLDEARGLAHELARQPRDALRESKSLLNMYVRSNIENVLSTLFERQFERMQGAEHCAIVDGMIARKKRTCRENIG